MIQDLTIEATSNTPQIVFKTNGSLILNGRSYLIDVRKFYQPIFDWVSQLKAEKVRFIINLDYFNSASAKVIFEILKTIDDNDLVLEFDVIWKYETDDEDVLESGQIFEKRLKRARFCYNECSEA